MDYVVPTAAQIPAMTVEHIETPSPWTINGIKGMGEGGTIGATAVVARAVGDALRPLGARVNTLPLTAARVFQTIQTARSITPGQQS
jgi:carbon-monoxide dehydrogenase large subunit